MSGYRGQIRLHYVSERRRDRIFVHRANDYPGYYEGLHYLPVETNALHLAFFDSISLVALSSISLVTLQRKNMKLVWHDLFLVNLHRLMGLPWWSSG